MSEPKVRFHGYGYGNAGNRELMVSIDGRQALKEGPRKVGYCCYCKCLCRGETTNCAPRVWAESLALTRAKPDRKT